MYLQVNGSSTNMWRCISTGNKSLVYARTVNDGGIVHVTGVSNSSDNGACTCIDASVDN